MKNKKIYLLIVTIFVLITACSNDDPDTESIFNINPPERNEFDKWILNHFVNEYNIDYKYRMEDIETNNTYNLAPADYDKSIVLAKLVKFLWIESYDELMGGKDFMREYSPKVIHLVGSLAFNSGNEVVLGTAEGGIKITLYNVNGLENVNDLDFLNEWFFKTMHHEFAHILHQTKNYNIDFNLISNGLYEPTNWVNRDDDDALRLGFVTPYASKEPQEDFVETIAVFVTSTESEWERLLTIAEEDGASIILQKFDMVKSYLANSWDIDLVELRDIVQRRSLLINNDNFDSSL